MALNLRASFLGTKHVWKPMKAQGGGVIVNVGSLSGSRSEPMLSAYAASKWGLNGFTKSVAEEGKADNIRVNLVAPGPTDTPMTRSTIAKPGSGMAEKIGQAIPLGRLATSEEVAEACVWLCSEAARFVTGAIVPVDGGFTDK